MHRAFAADKSGCSESSQAKLKQSIEKKIFKTEGCRQYRARAISLMAHFQVACKMYQDVQNIPRIIVNAFKQAEILESQEAFLSLNMTAHE